MDQTEFVLGAIAVRNANIWGAEVPALTGSEAFEAIGMGMATGQFYESKRMMQ